MGLTKEQYNSEPIFYCRNCLSLRVKTVGVTTGLDFCDECGSTDIEKTDIETWKELYRNKYGFDYLDKKEY